MMIHAPGRRSRRPVLAVLAAVAALAAVTGCGGAATSSSGSPAAAGHAGATSAAPGAGLAAAATPSPAVSPALEPSGAGSGSGVTGGALFGGNGALVSQEGKLGRTLAVVREYYNLGHGYNTDTAACPGRKGPLPPHYKHKPTTPPGIYGPAIAFAYGHGRLPVFVSEWGSTPYASPQAQPDFIGQMQAYVTASHEIAAALYWDSSGPNCSYVVNGDPASVSALARMAHSPDLQGRIVARG